jgi:hypothetical protein
MHLPDATGSTNYEQATENSLIYWAQLTRFRLQTEAESSVRNWVF